MFRGRSCRKPTRSLTKPAGPFVYTSAQTTQRMTVAAPHTISTKSIGILLSESGPGRRGLGAWGRMTAGTGAPSPGRQEHRQFRRTALPRDFDEDELSYERSFSAATLRRRVW